MSLYHKSLMTQASIPYDKIALDVANWDAIDDIVDFILACIADDEVAEAVVEAIKQRSAD